MPRIPASLRSLRPTPALLLLAWLAASPAGGQPVLRDDEDLAFDRPEAWAMAWFAAVTLHDGLGGPRALEPGEVELAFDAASVPSLSREERRVGFRGTKVEDLNRTAVVGRPTLAVGLPAGWTLEAGWMPPIDVDGIEPDLRSLALSRHLLRGDRLHLASRLLVEHGTFRGDLTCSRDDVSRGPDPTSPVFLDCEAPSDDELEVTLWGAELQAALPGARWTPYLALGHHRLDAALQIDARYNGLLDRSRLTTEGGIWTTAAGLTLHPRPRWRLAAELLYAPLDAARRTGRTSDPLLHARARLAYRLR